MNTVDNPLDCFPFPTSFLMNSFFFRFSTGLLVLLVALRLPAAAQVPAWQSAQVVAGATAAARGNHSHVRATAIDAAGNVYLAGDFKNTVTLGGITLTSVGDYDVFVAKFNPATNQFVWAQRAGGADEDRARALVVSGTSVYVGGHFESSTAGFGTTTLTCAGAKDLFVAKLTDAGGTGSFGWAQRAGGPQDEEARALAVSGTSVYVAGDFDSPKASFGVTTLSKAGGSDAFVAKLIDAGTTARFAWAQRAGGTDNDQARALAVNGTSVYVAGEFGSPTASFGATTLTCVGNADVFVAKLTDAGGKGAFAWAQRAGGPGREGANALAVNGTSVYVAGDFNSPAASFGTATLACATSAMGNVFVAKLTDADGTGRFVWAQQSSSPWADHANALAVSGTSVYVAGFFASATAGFGATTLTTAGSSDVFVAKLADAGSTGCFGWAQRAGGLEAEEATALAVRGTSVYVAGGFDSPTASFGTTAVANPYPGGAVRVGFLATLSDLASPTTGPQSEPGKTLPTPR